MRKEGPVSLDAQFATKPAPGVPRRSQSSPCAWIIDQPHFLDSTARNESFVA